MISLFDKRIKEVIREELEKLLVERLSVSEEVTQATNLLMKEIVTVIDTQEPCKVEANGTGWYDEKQEWHNGVTVSYHFRPSEEVQRLVGEIRYIDMSVYYFANKQAYAQQYHMIQNTARYSPTLQAIEMFFPAVGHRIVTDVCKKNLMHELEHKFQSEKVGGEITNDVYRKACGLTDSNNALIKSMAWLLYFFHPRELDAKLHEMYYYLCSKRSLCSYEEMKNFLPYQEMIFCLKNYLEPLKTVNQTEVNAVLQDVFGVRKDAKWLFRYIEHQRQYFVNKLRKIYTRALEVANI